MGSDEKRLYIYIYVCVCVFIIYSAVILFKICCLLFQFFTIFKWDFVRETTSTPTAVN